MNSSVSIMNGPVNSQLVLYGSTKLGATSVCTDRQTGRGRERAQERGRQKIGDIDRDVVPQIFHAVGTAHLAEI
jgi:hypothetical protein